MSLPELFCPGCGYNLRGIESDLCPECGMAIDRVAFAQSQLPWSHRMRIGRVRAYVRTLAMAGLDSPRLALEVARPVSFGDAQRFRFITIALAWIPLAVMAIWVTLQIRPTMMMLLRTGTMMVPSGFDAYWPWLTGALAPGVAPLVIAIFLILLSGVASYFFHPASISVTLQNRAVALSYYGSAPLLLLPIGLFCLVLLAQMDDSSLGRGHVGFQIRAILSIIAGATPLICVVWWWLSMLRLHRRIVHQSGGGSVVLALALPVLAIFLFVLTVGGLIWVIGFVVLVVRSILF